MKSHKYERILDIYIALSKGKIVNMHEYALRHEVDSRILQRDIDDIRSYISNSEVFEAVGFTNIVYDRAKKGYKAA